MNGSSIRTALAVLNVALTIAVVALGYGTFFTRHDPPAGDCVPAYHPVKLALPAQSRPQDPLAEYTVVWAALEKPPPPPPPPAPVEPPKPTVQNLEQVFKLVLVAMHPEDPKLNSCILEPRTGGEQLVVNVGDTWSGYKCKSIEQTRDEKGPICVVTLVDPNGMASPIRLRRD